MQESNTVVIRPVNNWAMAAKSGIQNGIKTAGEFILWCAMNCIAVPPSGVREIVRVYDEANAR